MSFLNCNIWEVNQFPRYGSRLNRYTLSNIFGYDSNTTEYQSNNFKIQIPEFEIQMTEEQRVFINKYKDSIAKHNIPILVLLNNEEEEKWVVGLNISDYLLRRITKEI